MKLTVLGSGTSSGVPRIPVSWGRCDPNNPRNMRRRASVLIEEGDTRVIIDTTPDLRMQMIDAEVPMLDAVFYTHDHADHTHGIDDIRGFFHASGVPIPIYGDAKTLRVLEERFGYIFTGKKGYPAIATAHELTGPQAVGDIIMQPFEQQHGPITSLGYRFGDMAYSTDLNGLSEKAFKALEGIKVWVVDALRYEPHPTHSHLEQTLTWIERVKPERAYLTHMTNDMDYETLKTMLPDGVEPAYDGLVIEL